MERLPTIVVAAVGLGIVEQSVVWGWDQRQYVEPVLFVIVLVALLVTPAGAWPAEPSRTVDVARGARAPARAA